MLGLVESVDKKLDKLTASDFNAGVRHLKELLIATKEQEFLLKKAWERFEIAITHEVGERRALAYIGLAYCQYRLDEKQCALSTLQEFTTYNYEDKKERTKKELMTWALMYPPITLGAALALATGVITMPKEIKESLNSANIKEIQAAFLKWKATVPSEQRISSLKQQAQEFLNEEQR